MGEATHSVAITHTNTPKGIYLHVGITKHTHAQGVYLSMGATKHRQSIS
jgi:hypothetical protein